MITIFNDFEECLKEYERIRPWVLNALWYEDTGMTERELIDEIARRKLVLITIDTAYALISFCNSEDHIGFVSALDIEDEDKFALLHLIGGRMNQSLESIFDAMPEVEEYVKSRGFKKIVAIGRKGWKRFVEKHGFETEPLNEKENKYKKEVL
jgi:hypothetical protein